MSECIADIGKLLNNEGSALKDRFRALFTLKNMGGNEAIDLIGQSFSDSSALLKHELAYCLGQMQDSYAIPILTKVLMDKTQEPMVRHEAGTSSTPFFRVYIPPLFRRTTIRCRKLIVSQGSHYILKLRVHQLFFFIFVPPVYIYIESSRSSSLSMPASSRASRKMACSSANDRFSEAWFSKCFSPCFTQVDLSIGD